MFYGSSKHHGSGFNVTFLGYINDLRDLHLAGFTAIDQSQYWILEIACQSSLYDFCRCFLGSSSGRKEFLPIFFLITDIILWRVNGYSD